MMMLVSIAAGGAIGALGRHFVSIGAASVFGLAFPCGTLLVNVIGSFLMGLLIAAMAQWVTLSEEMRGFLAVGFLGAFTTFSTFSLDAVSLYERGEIAQAGLYVGASVILSIAGLMAGLFIVRALA